MKWKRKCLLCLLPSLLGIALFYIIPFIKVLYYSMIDSQFDKNFVGLRNYAETIHNAYFLLALKNSLCIILICVPVLIALSVFIAVAMQQRSRLIQVISVFFIMPMVLPTAAVVPIWKILFQNTDSVLPVYLLFIWKNIGICVILISAAVNGIPKELHDAARIDGAEHFARHLYITIPCALPSILFAALLSIVNSFRIYKESYLYFGTNYPPEHSYTLQYYMNNNFMKLDYPALSAGAVLNTLLILVLVAAMMKLQRKYTW